MVAHGRGKEPVEGEDDEGHRHEHRRQFQHAGERRRLACTLGIVPHLVAAMMGLAALLHTSALAYNLVKYAGVAYLLWMAWQTLREDGALKVEAGEDRRSSWRVIVDGIAINVLNPKLSIFFVAFLPQFITPEAAIAPQLWILAITFVVMAVINATLYAMFAAAAHRLLASPRAQRRFNLAGGLLLAAAGVWALLARRPA